MRTPLAFTALAALSLAGCIIEEPVPYQEPSYDWDYGDDDFDHDDNDGDEPKEDDEADDSWAPDTFILSGKVHNLLSSAEGGEGLCVTVVDPAPAFDNGSEMLVLAQGEVLSDSTWRIEGVPLLTQGIGALVVLDDCETDLQDSALPSGSHISQRLLNQIDAGETVRNFNLFLVDDTGQDLLQVAFEEMGREGDWTDQGALMGFVLDKDGFPVEGAEVSSETSGQAYYLTKDISLRTEGGTDAMFGSVFAIPEAPLDWFSARVPAPISEEPAEGTEDGGEEPSEGAEEPIEPVFEEHYIGGLPDMVIFMQLMEI